jgi:hypothetical protein
LRARLATLGVATAVPVAGVSPQADPPPVEKAVENVMQRNEAELRAAKERERLARARARKAEHRVRIHVRQLRKLRTALRWKFGGVTAGLLCIHRYEGSWTDPGSPYWGGLQQDRSFMNTYAPSMVRRYGTADHWPAEAQLAAGTLAYYDGRGYTPWPNTSRMCGLR